jgi:hypothetical protein
MTTLRAKHGSSVDALMDKLLPVLGKKMAERFRTGAARG